MTTFLIGNKEIKANLSLTKASVFPNDLNLLSNPLLNKKIKIESFCNNGKINDLFNKNKRIKTSASTYTSTFTSNFSNNKKYRKTINKINRSIQNQDSGYIIPLNVDDNIEDLYNLIQHYNKIDQYPTDKYYKLSNDKNNFIYQYINNELYILTSVIKNLFNTSNKKQLFDEITNHLYPFNCFAGKFACNFINFTFNLKLIINTFKNILLKNNIFIINFMMFSN
jgi:hypothetical protein